MCIRREKVRRRERVRDSAGSPDACITAGAVTSNLFLSSQVGPLEGGTSRLNVVRPRETRRTRGIEEGLRGELPLNWRWLTRRPCCHDDDPVTSRDKLGFMGDPYSKNNRHRFATHPIPAGVLTLRLLYRLSFSFSLSLSHTYVHVHEYTHTLNRRRHRPFAYLDAIFSSPRGAFPPPLFLLRSSSRLKQKAVTTRQTILGAR